MFALIWFIFSSEKASIPVKKDDASEKALIARDNQENSFEGKYN